MLRFAPFALCAVALSAPAPAQNPPAGFTAETVLTGLESPASFDFAPDGRMFFTERVAGSLRVATETPAGSGDWTVDPQPYATFDVPKVNGVPTAHRSSGVRGFAFDPDFASNGHVYVFYMKDNPRRNRVVRIRQDPADTSRALPGETLLIELPFNGSTSSGSHNGGALRFGDDGMLYVTTGDGWSGGDGVQSLSTFTGKVLRIRPNGSIPNDNPFYSATTGAYRAIWALGLRNPYTLTRNTATGELLIGEANGSDKADVLRLERAANYAHQGYGGIGNRRSRWTNGASAGSAMISGGAWYPSSGPFPAQYRGAYFMCLWGTNGANGGPPGQISYVRPATNGAVSAFQTQVGAFDGAGTRLKPVHLRVGPDGALYYLLTSYLTGSGSIERIRYAGGTTVQAPTFQPDGGTFPSALGVSVSSATPGAVVRYTLDGSTPTSGSPVAPALVRITSDATLRARAFLGAAESAVRSADYVVGAATNQPPVVSAGPNQVVEFGQLATLNGAATYDPDGSDLNLSDAWTQVSGPTAYLANADETTAFAYVRELGVYRFRLTVTDGFDSAYDEVEVRVVDCINDVTDGLVARWSLDQGAGATAIDSAAGIWNGALEGPAWSTLSVPNAGSALSFDGANDVLQVGAPDVSGPGFTASAWVRPDDFGVEDARILSKATGTPEQEHFWMLSTVRSGNEHVLRFRLRVDGTTRTLVASGGALRANTWAAVAATWNGARMRIWVDGTEVGSLAVTGALSTDPGVPAAIGNQPQGGRAFDGHVDEVRLYSRALSRRELRILAGRTVRGDCRENAARH